MGRFVNLVLLAMMLVGAVITYDLKRQTGSAAADVARLNAEIARERDRIANLRAEWSMRTQPGRLQAVVEEHAGFFQLEPFAPEQIGTIGEIPLRPLGGNDEVRELLARMAASQPGLLE